MKFTKMQGIGNDYVYVNCFEEKVEDASRLAVAVSDRHFGIGSDGLILIKPSKVADCQMDMYNLDGTRGAMCGNGVRCVGKYAYDHHIVDKPRISVETASGIKYLDMEVEDGKVTAVTVDMGKPVRTSELFEEIEVNERGSGETMACGTGACATAVAAILSGYADDTVEVELLGGCLTITWDREKDTVYMTGPAVEVFNGEYTE